MSHILPRDTAVSVGEAIVTAAQWLSGFDLGFGHGSLEYADDAAWIVLESAGLSPVTPPDYEALLTEDAIEQAEAWLRRRAYERIPVPYLTGRTWFAGLEFRTDNRALIPRSPLAELIQHDFFGFLPDLSSLRVLDLCTGGGCIALAIAAYYGDASVVGTDISADALELAHENRALLGLDDRVQWVQGDLFSAVQHQTFDLIISNPPYVDKPDLDAMPQEFHAEPVLGLASGDDGLDITHRILKEAGPLLSDTGVLIVEVGNSAEALTRARPDIEFGWIEFENGGDGVFLLERTALVSS